MERVTRRRTMIVVPPTTTAAGASTRRSLLPLASTCWWPGAAGPRFAEIVQLKRFLARDRASTFPFLTVPLPMGWSPTGRNTLWQILPRMAPIATFPAPRTVTAMMMMVVVVRARRRTPSSSALRRRYSRWIVSTRRSSGSSLFWRTASLKVSIV